MVRRLTAGGNEIRTLGPFFAVKGLLGAFVRYFWPRRAVPFPPSAWRRASHHAPRSGQHVCAGHGDADMVRANPRACGGDFLLRLTRCQGKDLIAEA